MSFLANLFWSQVEKNDGKKIEVLSRDTGSKRDYNRSPYGSYETNNDIYFPVDKRGDRLGEKEVVYGILVWNEAVALVEKTLPEKFSLSVNGANINGTYIDGRLRLKRTDTGKEVVAEREFWFAWVAFHNETGIFP